MIRWKAVVPLLLFIVGITVFCAVFLDPLAEKALEWAGSRAAGAKVEIASCDIGILKTRVTIRGLAVADRSEPMTNLFELERLNFDYRLEPIFTKKFIVQEMAAEGLRWGTPRKTSGALPLREKKKGPSVFAKLADEAKLPNVDLKQMKSKDWQSQVKAQNLQSLKFLDDTKARSQTLKADWDKKLETLQVQPTVDKMKTALEAAKAVKVEGIEDLPKAKEALENLKEAQSEFQAKVQELKNAEASMKKDLAQARGSLNSVESVKDRDVQGILNKLQLPDLSAKGMARALFGPLWLSKLDKAFYWVEQARKYMPSKQDKEEIKKEPPPRREGMTVTFPGRRAWPQFAVEKISISGSTGKTAGEAKAIDFSGQILGVNSDPPVYGKPVTLDLRGSQGPLALSVKGLLDHTGEVSKDEFMVSANGLSLAGQTWAAPAFLPGSIANGTAQADFRFGMTGPELSASLAVKAQGLAFGESGPAQNDVESLIQKVFSDVKSLTLSASARGTKDNVDFSVDTSLDDLLSGRLKAIAGEEIGKLKGQIQAKVDEMLQGKKAEVQGMLDGQEKALLGNLGTKSGPLTEQGNQLQSVKAQLEERIQQKASQGLPKAVPKNLKKIFH